MNLGGHDIGVCDWSLKPADTDDLIGMLDQIGLSHIQIALAPLMGLSIESRGEKLAKLADAGIEITCGMIGFEDENYSTIASIRKTGGFVSPALWPHRRDRAIASAQLATEIGVSAITAHAGFIPPSGDPTYRQIIDHLGQLATEYDKLGVEFLLETGQESARELLQFLNDLNCPNVGVNFDPGNMILYGAGDPIEAVATLGRHIRHVHIKDAEPSTKPGTDWGKEVPFGSGKVDVHALLRGFADVGYEGPLVIEREAGPNRLEDVRKATEVLAAHYGE